MLQSWMTVRVKSKKHEAADVVVLELVDVNGGDLPSFSAGSHIDVELAPGLVRQYSLCNNSSERSRYEIGVLKEPESRGGSVALHENLKEGDVVRISAPRNHFALDSSATRSLLFAGGIGVTPILCMAERLARTNMEFSLHYCSRSPDRAAFRTRLANSTFKDRVRFHFDDGPAEQRLDIDSVLGPFRQGSHVYVCGPGGFIEWVLGAARKLGWPDATLHREYFVPPKAEPSAIANETFSIRIASTGQVLEVPADRSIMDVLMDAGIELPSSCEQGVCGSCMTRILEGIPEHKDFYLTEEERAKNDQFTPCCSRSKSPLLVLDL